MPTVFQGTGVLLAIVAVFGVINLKYLKKLNLPDTLGITLTGLIICLVVSLVGMAHPEMGAYARQLITHINFSEVVFHGLLSFLLFASALHIDFSRLREHKVAVVSLATLGVLISTAIVGAGMYTVTLALGHPVPLPWCLVFGALISPTDPIAVLAVLKRVGAPPSLEAKISSEALLNDGTAMVAFLTLVGLATGASEFSITSITTLLLREVAGALVFGVLVGRAASWLLSGIDSSPVEILITLALATGGYSLAESLHVSAPLAIVTIGLVVGNHGATRHMSARTREHLFGFWGVLDELLNLVLFGLIGVEVIALSFKFSDIWIGVAAFAVVLIARAVSVAIPMAALRRFRRVSPHAVKIMTWGGLRGGISIALALTLPEFQGRDMVVGVTYLIVVFSLLVQATTLGRVVRRYSPPSGDGA
ncbi:sodium:proton antiporter [Roseateles aquatilis]|uniref:Sodium:proton antiporter n=1 Tax=Roseateles aquatilis TaxID=431061 RepID=A0A246J8P8_9BURK|nr:sodium:proton antiporter [Roseateles aquatilis]MBY0365364.1 sodium:proton antiporter [Burkholderiaceae bacterium]OWQ88913.1 sodium:proton antiporter [Roseateles aquatilis]